MAEPDNQPENEDVNGPEPEAAPEPAPEQENEQPAPARPISAGGSFGIGAAIGAAGNIGVQLMLGLGLIAGILVGGSVTAGLAATSPALGMAAGALAGGGVFGASCYSTYKVARAVYNKVRDNERLDKPWTLAGAITGAIGLSFLSTVSGTGINVDFEVEENNDNLQGVMVKADPDYMPHVMGEESWSAPELGNQFETAVIEAVIDNAETLEATEYQPVRPAPKMAMAA